MENIIGIKFNVKCTPQNIEICSEISVCCCRCLMQDYPVTYSQILYPYADALSLSNKKGTEGTRIFGTHMIFRGVDREILESAIEFGVRYAADKFNIENELKENFISEFVQFDLIDGNAAASEIHQFLSLESCETVTVGNFGLMLSGFLPHWRIRESSRIFASFAEMSYRKSNGKVCGLAGGSLALSEECDCMDELINIFHQKTGC